jgi:hypothetical protein
MRKRKLLLALAGLVAVVALAASVTSSPPQPASRITPENCDRIKPGMTLAQVKAILGPPGDYTTGPVDFSPTVCWQPSNATVLAEWQTDAGTALLLSDLPGCPLQCAFYPCERAEQGPVANILWRFKRQWRRWFPD